MDDESDKLDLLTRRLEELQAEVRDLVAERRQLGTRSSAQRRRNRAAESTDPSDRVSRRRMLGAVGRATAVGVGAAAAGVLLDADSAAASPVTLGTADGDALQIGGANTGSGGITSLSAVSTAESGVFVVMETTAGAGTTTALTGATVGAMTGRGIGVYGFTASTIGYGVSGEASGINGIGVVGYSETGAALQLGNGSGVTMPPTTGTWKVGSFAVKAGHVWYCYVAGVGSASKWVRLSASFVPLTPTRVYDSRVGTPLPTGILASGSNRLVSVADGRNSAGVVVIPDLVPPGASAVTANVTVTGTTGGFGYLAINPGGNTVEGASTINWFGGDQTIANGVTLTLNASRELTVICNGGGSTHFIIDISGYYL